MSLEYLPSDSPKQLGLNFSAQCFYIISVGIFLLGLIVLKYQIDIDNLRKEFRGNASTQSMKVVDSISQRFENLHHGVQTLANLQSVRNSLRDPVNNDPAVMNDVKELFNLLVSFIDLSELYISQKDLDPNIFDPKLGDHQAPRYLFENHQVDGKDESGGEPVDYYEYLEIKNHLKWFNSHYSHISDKQGFRYPAQISKEVITGDNTYYNSDQPDNYQRLGMVYSVPFYNFQGELAGSISAVMLSRVLKNLLPNEFFAIHNSIHNFNIVGGNHSESENPNLEWINSSIANPNLIYSENIALLLPDEMGAWNLWVGVPDRLFWQQQEVKSTQLFTVLSSLATIVLCMGLLTFLFTNERQRKISLELKNQLEYKAQQRSIELKSSETRSQAILDNAADGIIIYDEQGTIETFNQAAEKMFGYSDFDSIGESIFNIIPELFPIMNEMRDENSSILKFPYQCEVHTQSRQGKDLFLEVHINKIDLLEKRLFSGICRDVTKHKMSETEILRAKDEAERATQAKSDFLANMSHELRTPLNAIIGYTEILKEDATDNRHTFYHRDIEQILSAANQLLNQVNCILDLSKIEAGKMELMLSNFSINDVLISVIDTVKPMLLQQNNKLSTDFSNKIPQMEADAIKIKQIALNLFSNAIKFTHNGQIGVSSKLINKHGIDWVEITVKDSGIGMHKEQMSKIFQMFTQIDSSYTKKYSGTGLGLSISKHFCEMMGGSIRVTSEINIGTTFTVTIPLQVIGPKVDPVSVRFPSDVSLRHSRRIKISRVLIISNSRLSQDLLDRFLSREGFFTDISSNVSHAMSMICQNPPDVIVIDENSLNYNAVVDLSRFRDTGELADIPIILLTRSDSRELTRALGAIDFLHKPPRRSEVIDLVKKFTRERSSNDYILIVDEQPQNQLVIQEILNKEGIRSRIAESAQHGLEIIRMQQPKLIFIDFAINSGDGFNLAEKIRATPAWENIPIVTVSNEELSDEQMKRLLSVGTTVIRQEELEPAALLNKMRDILVAKLRTDAITAINKIHANG